MVILQKFVRIMKNTVQWKQNNIRKKYGSSENIYILIFKNNVDKTFIIYYIISVKQCEMIFCTCKSQGSKLHKQAQCGGIAQLARAIGSYPAGHKFKSYCRYQFIGPIVKRLRHHPFTVKSAVRIRLGSP